MKKVFAEEKKNIPGVNMMQSKKLLKFSSIFHGFTTREEGDMRRLKTSQNLKVVLANQVHGDVIVMVGEKDKGGFVKKTDGLLTSTPGVFLGIRTADCLPILFYEPKAKIVAVVHAGWKGTLLGISQKMVKEMESLGGKAKNIVASFGPHIGMCCYNIDKKRVKLFTDKFGKDPRIVSFFEGKPHLDLAFVNFLQLSEVGVLKENIEAHPSCTFCNRNLFFSFRRSKKEDDRYGEMLSTIGLL